MASFRTSELSEPVPGGKHVSAVIFDLDGVLVDLCELHRDVFIMAFNACNPERNIDNDFHNQHLEGLSTASKLRKLGEMFGMDCHTSEVANMKQKLTMARLAGEVFPSRAKNALTWLKSRGLKIAVYTNSVRATLDCVLAKLGLTDLVNFAFSNEDVPEPKPSPQGYINLMQRLNADADEVLIFEDSAPGLAAARGSGATVIPIIDSLDITPAFLDYAIKHRQRPVAPKLRIVVPMAGLGSRFQQDGYVVQKPFLPTLAGLQLWEEVVENLMPKDPKLRSVTEVHLVVRQEQLSMFRSHPHVHLHTVPGLTEGAACTVLTLKDIINDDVPLMIGNSDQYLEWDSDDFYAAAFHPSYDGAISTFYHPYPEDLKWSYAALSANGTVSAVAEKKYLGPHATTGLYAWKKGRDFVEYAERMIKDNIRVNNEFYVCPVYNGALTAGKTFRVVNCEKFWGVGVPVDYMKFIDHFRPREHPQDFHSRLASKYAGMWCKWASRLPEPQPSLTSDPTLCAAMWCTGSFAFTPALAQLRRALAPWAHKFTWYGLSASQPAPQAVVHHTFFQFRTFPLEESAATSESMQTWATTAQQQLLQLPPYYLDLVGAAPVKSGVVLCGNPPRDYSPVRAALRAAAPCVEPHAQDIHHVSILRWTSALTAPEYQAVCAVLDHFRTTRFGMLQPEEWAVGYGTWCMRPETLRPVVQWKATPSPWVLHRGNTAGLDAGTENSPALLQKRLDAGWDVELDLWRVTGAEAASIRASHEAAHGMHASPASKHSQTEELGLWLGHDFPAYPLQEAQESSLLMRRGVWIHCKNLAAFAYLRAHPEAEAFHFFSHDKDPVAFTSRGIAWGYPDTLVPGPGTVSVVWPQKKEIALGPGVGVCCDWLPLDCIVKYM